MAKSVAMGLCVLLAACHAHTAPLGPAPKKFLSSLAPYEVAEAAKVELVARGFEVSANRANRGYISGTRKRRGSENSSFISCKNGLGDDGAFNSGTQSLVTEVRVFVSATPRQRQTVGQSDVYISVSVAASFVDAPSGVKPENNGDCVSSGAIEARLADLLDR